MHETAADNKPINEEKRWALLQLLIPAALGFSVLGLYLSGKAPNWLLGLIAFIAVTDYFVFGYLKRKARQSARK